MNEPDDRPAEDPAGGAPRGDVSTATGVTGLVALAQSLDEPWRTVLSVAGPWTVIFGRWLANRLEPAFHLLESELVLFLTRRLARDKIKIEAIEAEVQELRLLLLDQIRKKIRRSPPKRTIRSPRGDGTP